MASSCRAKVDTVVGTLPDKWRVVDCAGVSKPVLDMVRKAKVGASITPFFVASGKNSLPEAHGWLVPRQELAATLQVLFRLRVAPALTESAMLARELAAFQVKVSEAAETEMDTWRQGTRDDLVLALAVAAWLGEHVASIRNFIEMEIDNRSLN